MTRGLGRLVFGLFFLFLFSFCKNGKEGNDRQTIEQEFGLKNDTLSKDDPDFTIPFLWENYWCTLPEFSSFFWCDTSGRDYFEAFFHLDPFKGPVLISLYMDQGKIDQVFLTRLNFSPDSLGPVSKGFEKHFMVTMPYSNAQLCCSYNLPKLITDRTNMDQLNIFFSEIIWALPFKEEESAELDPELWYVLGRKNGMKYKWQRWAFSDSIYYSNLQVLLDLCGVEEYKYEKR